MSTLFTRICGRRPRRVCSVCGERPVAPDLEASCTPCAAVPGLVDPDADTVPIDVDDKRSTVDVFADHTVDFVIKGRT